MDLSVNNILGVFIIAIIVFLALDGLWLGVIAKDFYLKRLKPLMAEKPNWIAAGVFYSIFVIGLMFFAIVPALNEESLGIAMGRGAAYGFFTYATYDLTNLATLKKWDTKLVVVDILWGTLLAWAVATITYSIYIGIVG